MPAIVSEVNSSDTEQHRSSLVAVNPSVNFNDFYQAQSKLEIKNQSRIVILDARIEDPSPWLDDFVRVMQEREESNSAQTWFDPKICVLLMDDSNFSIPSSSDYMIFPVRTKISSEVEAIAAYESQVKENFERMTAPRIKQEPSGRTKIPVRFYENCFDDPPANWGGPLSSLK